MLFSWGAVRLVLLSLLVIPLAIPVLMGLPPDRPDPNRDFVGALRRDGMHLNGDTSGLVAQGHWICRQLNHNVAPADVMTGLLQAEPALLADHHAAAGLFLRDAAHWYCPAYEDAFDTVEHARPGTIPA